VFASRVERYKNY